MQKKLKILVVVLVVLFIGIQFIPTNRTNPPVDSKLAVEAHTQMNPRVAEVFQRACADCHSHQTRWPWYSYVAPFKWVVLDDVRHGRSHLNFSQWVPPTGQPDYAKIEKRLDETCEEVTQGKMPLASYRLLHPGSRLSAEDVKAICDWTETEMKRVQALRQSQSPPTVSPAEAATPSPSDKGRPTP